MSNTKQRLTTALLKHGRDELGKVWACSTPEVSRRLNEDRNISLTDLCNAMDEVGIQLVDDDDCVIIRRDELDALNLLANRYLERRVKGQGAA